ncbi:TatD family hydrolase [Lunatimonas salinarum]|uniref:TatD family hydrolase n=1 Tax=Lunatimonas salinarum TaxID=1774590 RepID=UPI001AE07DC0|nr:TatD family hydrolase [Lunatimonas salinarum]
MMYLDPHIHMVSRTTNDYEAMKKAGIVAVIEPAFWLGQPRTTVGSFQDYFSTLVGWERFRAKQFGIKHYCTIGLNSKEANNVALAEEVMELLPLYAGKEGVVAIGEIGYDDQTEAEDRFFRAQLELAKEMNLPVMIHTPHRDKRKGTLRSMAVCEEHGMDPTMVVVDHNNEETVKDVLDRGYWAGFTIYPHSKMDSTRMAVVVEQYGPDRIIVDSSADWGVSDPLAVPRTAQIMRDRGISEAHIRMTSYQNALDIYGKSGQIKESDWLSRAPINQTELHDGNSVLRGQTPLVEDEASVKSNGN